MRHPWARRALVAAAVAGTFAVLAIVLLPLALLPGFRQPLAATPDTVGLAFEAVRIAAPGPGTGDSGELPGWWMPADGARGAIVLVHDGAANRSMLWTGEMALVKRLHDAGYAVLTFDLPGHGEAPEPRDGAPTGRNVARDVAAAIGYAHARAPELPVFVHGFGLGGVAALYAVADGADVAALSVDSVWADLAESLRGTLPNVTPVPARAIPPSLYVAEHLYGIDFDGSRARDVVANVSVPLLVIVNAADRQVLPAHSEELARKARLGTLWITAAPPPEHPIYRERGSWGTHSQSFALAPEEYVVRLVRHFEHATEIASPGATHTIPSRRMATGS